MRKLLIVESPAKIKTISKFVGKEFVIMSTFGHVKDLPQNKIGVVIDDNNTVNIDYEPLPDKATTIAQICKKASNVDEVYLASDPDREGEIISWHIGGEIQKVLKKTGSMHRIVFNEITKPAIEKAIVDKRTINMDKVYAQQARRILDRWVGYEVSPILWRKITKGLSAGRVQSVALMLVCIREREIEVFKPEESWSVHGVFDFNSEKFDAELSKINGKKAALKNKEQADKVVAQLPNESFTVKKITDKKRLKKPLAPFMTSTLQQDAYNKLGFSVDRTMSIAQKLYEGLPLQDKNSPEALITYMRTDSMRISEVALQEARDFIKHDYGSEYLPKSAQLYDKKGATQDAHEAVRPIDVRRTPEMVGKYLSADQAKLYKLIWRRFVASQMNPAHYFQRVVELESPTFTFRTVGSTLMFDGFLKVYKVEDEDEKKSVKIPKGIAESSAVDLTKHSSKQHFTKPPARYSQATLVKELEKQDIGRPSTYAATLSTLQKRKYVTVENKRFHPSELGKSVNNLLVENLPDIINVSFTANMEKSLDKIANGETERDTVLLSFYKKFSEDVKKFAGADAKKAAIPANISCPECKKGNLFIRFGRSGEFVGCENYPECKFTSNFSRAEDGTIKLQDKEEKQEAEKTGLFCPNCKRELVKKIGKYGPFIACPGYPECKHIHQETLKMPCPKCGGKIAKRRWRGGEFWGCSSYPKCKFAIFSKVEEKQCPQCKKSKYLLISYNKDKEEVRSCPDKECGYTTK